MKQKNRFINFMARQLKASQEPFNLQQCSALNGHQKTVLQKIHVRTNQEYTLASVQRFYKLRSNIFSKNLFQKSSSQFIIYY